MKRAYLAGDMDVKPNVVVSMHVDKISYVAVNIWFLHEIIMMFSLFIHS